MKEQLQQAIELLESGRAPSDGVMAYALVSIAKDVRRIANAQDSEWWRLALHACKRALLVTGEFPEFGAVRVTGVDGKDLPLRDLLVMAVNGPESGGEEIALDGSKN